MPVFLKNIFLMMDLLGSKHVADTV